MIRVALVGQLGLTGQAADDHALRAALEALGAHVALAAWDDPVVNWSAFDAALLRATWNYATQRDAFVEWAWSVGGQTRLFNRPRVVEWNSHKGYLIDLMRAGVPVVPTHWLDPGAAADVAALMDVSGWAEAVLKPTISQSARETLRFGADAQGVAAAQDHVDRLLPLEGLMLQPYLSRVTALGEVSVQFVDGAATHAVRKVPADGDYRVQAEFGGRDSPFQAPGRLVELSRLAMAAAEVHLELEEPLLYARVDWLQDFAGGWVLNELELIEPELFFRHAPHAAQSLAGAVVARLRA